MESTTINNAVNAIKEVRELFTDIRSNLYREKKNEIREKLYNLLKEKKQEDSLTNNEKKVLKNLKEDLEKLQKYQYNITYRLDYLFNELNEDYYEPKEIKNAFNGSYMLYESKGDKDAKLAIYEYFDIIRPHLRDMIDNYKARSKWKNTTSNANHFCFFY